ncbi:MAG: YigZ family protein [Acidobacteriota bacterium]
MAEIRTLVQRHRHEIDKIKGSRFFATVAPTPDVAAALALVDALRAEFRDATHHCWAYRLFGADDFRYSDDGEPSGSAGRPILVEIDARELSGVAVVVTRYYGGTKLGTGGLVRAYSAAAAAALDHAEIVTRRITRRLDLTHGYDLTADVQRVLSAAGLEPTHADYSQHVHLTLDVPVEDVDTVRQQLIDATAGRINVQAAS